MVALSQAADRGVVIKSPLKREEASTGSLRYWLVMKKSIYVKKPVGFYGTYTTGKM